MPCQKLKFSVMLSLFLVFALALGLGSCAHRQTKATQTLRNPFSEVVITKNLQANEMGVCPAVPAPVVDVIGQTYYKDSHHSVIDPEKLRRSREMVQPLRNFGNQIAKWSDSLWVRKDLGAEKCLLEWFTSWAKAGAMLGNANYQGEFERKWFLAGVSLSYLRIEKHVDWNKEDKILVLDWFERLAKKVRSDYEQKLEKQSRHNNHIYWAALAVMAASIAIDNRDLYDWALVRAKQGAMDVTLEGFLPEELDRASRARHYQSFALQALTMLAFLTEKNGFDLYSVNDQALDRLIKTTVEGYRNNSIFERASSFQQEPVDPRDFNWVPVYRYQHPKNAVLIGLSEEKSLYSSWLGGNLSEMFPWKSVH